MKEAIQPRENYSGATAWIWGGRFGLERYLYLLHRLTGLGLILFTMIHLTVTTFFRLPGQSVWDAAMALLSNPIFMVGEYLVAVAFVFHALNGLRLVLNELGFALGKPVRPTYPFKDAARKRRGWTVLLLAVVVVIAFVFLLNFFIGG